MKSILASAFAAVAFLGAMSTQAAAAGPSASAGAEGFDFLVGTWRVHHRLIRASDRRWWTFEGTCVNRALIDGSANIEEHTFNKPTGVAYGIALRTFDANSGQWAIWWIDSRVPHAMDPPMKGRFENGVGTFFGDGELDSKPIRVRFIWSQITTTGARWEQAYSSDGGSTWETNWIMEFRRAS